MKGWPQILASLGLFVAFFLPWFAFDGVAVPGYRAVGLPNAFLPYLALPGSPVYSSYLIYFVPAFAALTALTALLGRRDAPFGLVAGLLPLVLLVLLWVQLGNNLFGVMAAGFVLALAAAPLVLLGSVGALKVAYGIDWLTTRLGGLMYWVALAMVAIGASYVVMRYVGRSVGGQVAGANFFRELQIFLFNMTFLLAAAFVLKEDAHVRVDLIYSNLKPRAKAVVDIVGALFMLTPFCLLGLYLSHAFVMRSWQVLEISPNPGGLPLYPAKTLILVGFLLILLQGVSETIKNIAFLAGKLERQEDGLDHTSITEKTEAL
ncbi:hypothetical protein BH24DEI1_BH24DEI1_12290 [soil metagenome]|nr:TRAP transporter small permease subunit [Deinococcota bacterium]